MRKDECSFDEERIVQIQRLFVLAVCQMKAFLSQPLDFFLAESPSLYALLQDNVEAETVPDELLPP
jgi:hypothetical protein